MARPSRPALPERHRGHPRCTRYIQTCSLITKWTAASSRVAVCRRSAPAVEPPPRQPRESSRGFDPSYLPRFTADSGTNTVSSHAKHTANRTLQTGDRKRRAINLGIHMSDRHPALTADTTKNCRRPRTSQVRSAPAVGPEPSPLIALTRSPEALSRLPFARKPCIARLSLTPRTGSHAFRSISTVSEGRRRASPCLLTARRRLLLEPLRSDASLQPKSAPYSFRNLNAELH